MQTLQFPWKLLNANQFYAKLFPSSLFFLRVSAEQRKVDNRQQIFDVREISLTEKEKNYFKVFPKISAWD